MISKRSKHNEFPEPSRSTARYALDSQMDIPAISRFHWTAATCIIRKNKQRQDATAEHGINDDGARYILHHHLII